MRRWARLNWFSHNKCRWEFYFFFLKKVLKGIQNAWLTSAKVLPPSSHSTPFCAPSSASRRDDRYLRVAQLPALQTPTSRFLAFSFILIAWCLNIVQKPHRPKSRHYETCTMFRKTFTLDLSYALTTTSLVFAPHLARELLTMNLVWNLESYVDGMDQVLDSRCCWSCKNIRTKISEPTMAGRSVFLQVGIPWRVSASSLFFWEAWHGVKGKWVTFLVSPRLQF